MTREEACKILNIEEEAEFDHVEIMQRFETLFEKNNVNKGGSFYLQSKVYFAKEYLMLDYAAELNKSKFNPEEAGTEE
eukprot:CAMPEP_0170565326 /NCGR_PEP_ID=MMETSP0211-20121228/78206_1 /TAXON_ID=311385 /ORGANISM="Pseudokeronopsis sp., Strain OXSARD2" /LENGTH=77 /DNA_ID=CAMNT_0010885997 /DNA_START=108 /DNA_END=341 /DNA_ORIENTATION=+